MKTTLAFPGVALGTHVAFVVKAVLLVHAAFLIRALYLVRLT